MAEEKVQNGIVYLLGAGASVGALPTVAEMKLRMKVFLECLYISEKTLCIDVESTKRYQDLKIALQRLITNIEEYSSVDKYAKQLFLNGDKSSLEELKAVLGVYLIFEEMTTDEEIRKLFESKFRVNSFFDISEATRTYNGVNILDKYLEGVVQDLLRNGSSQYVLLTLGYMFDYNEDGYKNNKNNFDIRYSNFLLDILNSRSEFPNNIKIFSWNYDTQLSISAIASNFKTLISKKNSFEYKLNGEAAHKEINPVLGKYENIGEVLSECCDLFWRQMSENWDKGFEKENLRVKFAFEQKGSNFTDKDDFLSNIREITGVVIIGYSFPYVNRAIDKDIFKAILDRSVNPDKIYKNLRVFIQTPEDSFNTIKKEFIEVVKSVDARFTNVGNNLVMELYPNDRRVITIEHWNPDNFYIPHAQ